MASEQRPKDEKVECETFWGQWNYSETIIVDTGQCKFIHTHRKYNTKSES